MRFSKSHAGEQTFKDVMATTTMPVIASHSSVYSLCPHYRNLKDYQIIAIAKNGGVIHINFLPTFLDSDYPRRVQAFVAVHQNEYDSLKQLGRGHFGSLGYLFKQFPRESDDLSPPISIVIDHIDYIVDLVGVDYVGLGSDFDGISSTPRNLTDVSQFPNITKSLVERGYSETDIRKILGENFLRVFKADVD